MKSFFQFLFLGFISLSTASAAQTMPAELKSTSKEFRIDSSVGFGDQIYYHCRDVEYRIEDFLKKIGARDIKVRCAGGIDDFSPPMAWDSYVSLSFQSLRLSSSNNESIAAQWRPVEFRSFDNCFLYSQVFDEVKDSMEVRNLQEPWSCSMASSSFQIKFETLHEN